MIKKIVIYTALFLVLVFIGYILNYNLNPNSSKFAEPTEYRAIITGDSMSPLYPDGSEILFSTVKAPEVGDIVVFKCLSEKCVPEDYKLSDETYEFKVLEKKQGDQYWLEGMNDSAVCTFDNSQICGSFDSDNYGFIGEPDIKIIGVVIN